MRRLFGMDLIITKEESDLDTLHKIWMKGKIDLLRDLNLSGNGIYRRMYMNQNQFEQLFQAFASKKMSSTDKKGKEKEPDSGPEKFDSDGHPVPLTAHLLKRQGAAQLHTHILPLVD